MLEGRPRDSCLVSRLFTMSSHSQTKWSFFYSPSLCSNGKRPLLIDDYDDDDDVIRRPSKYRKPTLHSSHRSRGEAPPDDTGGGCSDGGSGESLIPGMNKDISITCLIRCSRADYCSIASLNRSFRSLVRTGEIYRLRRLHGMLEHWVYFSCNLLEWDAFDPRSERWMRLPSMPQNECFRYADKESLAVGTELLVFGWEVSSYVIYRYSLLTNSWSTGTSMHMPRCLFGSASRGEIAIVAGGCDSSGRLLDSAEMYNSEDETWTPLPPMKKPRKMCSGVFMDGKFYIIGGLGLGDGNEPKVLTCGEEYDLETKKWTEIPNMSPPRPLPDNGIPAAAEAPPLVAVVNNELYTADHAGMAVRRYDKKNRVWITVGALPKRAGSMNGWGMAFRACGDRLIVIGGPRNSGEGFIEINSWVPANGPPEWHLLGRKQSVNFVYNCAVMSC
ncbi:PREDICTED: F-box/kelch-repeat protein At1g26930 [Tarenaya hassleriana]|uniref:F-box/kelch-repeat protein At1g26930 n=1 Tax=Tarenaya hassleriana TaxID=28532 RepID=UPI00053C7E69|nr:PREDICTED: F-box/kelch-repeat protein At1g26930 [Tarenaya hassleriana]XP_010551525.1 PREDICTED: F-box/kelch-repeat protein At1g26930 [Tarenaya hassleriana]